jgi:hypothetical protein
MKRDRGPYVRQSDLNHEGEPSLRYMAEMWAKNAQRFEQKAAVARENARRYLEAADARAAEKLARKERRRVSRKAGRK